MHSARKRAAALILNLPLIKDFKTESAVFSAENQPEPNSASRISAEKMCQPEFGHKKIRLWGSRGAHIAFRNLYVAMPMWNH